MKKAICILCIACAAASASVMAAEQADSLPFVTNVKSIASRVALTQISGLTERETNKLDQITSSAAARAVLALSCQAGRGEFEAVSRRVEQMLEAKVVLVSSDTKGAKAYARDSAVMKYKAMAAANSGVACSDLDRLREIASVEGFDE